MSGLFQKRQVSPGRHAGDSIRALRKERGWTQDELAERAHVQRHYIASFEQFRYQDLPGKVYAVHFLRSIADAFQINASRLLAQFEEEYKEHPFKQTITPPKSVEAQTFLTPKRLRALLLMLLLVVGIGYVILEVSGLFSTPDLQLLSPQDNIEVTDAFVLVQGKTVPGASVTINNASVDVDDAGNFTAEIDLTPGVNELTIISTHKFGRQARVVRHIFARP